MNLALYIFAMILAVIAAGTMLLAPSLLVIVSVLLAYIAGSIK